MHLFIRIPTAPSFSIAVLVATLLCCLPAHAKTTLADTIKEQESDITENQLRLNDFQQRLLANHNHITKAQRNLNNTQLELKRFNHETLKIESLASIPLAKSDEQRLNQLAYKTKTAQISLKKQQQWLADLQDERLHLESRSKRLESLLTRLNNELDAQQENYKQAKSQWAQEYKQAQEKRLSEKNQQLELEKKQLQQAITTQQEAQKKLAQKHAEQQQHEESLALLTKIAANSNPTSSSQAKSTTKAEVLALLTKMAANSKPSASSQEKSTAEAKILALLNKIAANSKSVDNSQAENTAEAETLALLSKLANQSAP